jgi:O-methyltransferase domain/Dimerisation domain
VRTAAPITTPDSSDRTDRNTDSERAASMALLRMISGIHVSRAVYVAAALGIADLLADGPATASDLARATGTHEPSLYRVLRLLAALGVFEEHESRSFSLTTVGDRLRRDTPIGMRSWALLVDAVGGVAPFGQMLETVKTGRSGRELAFGSQWFDSIAANPEGLATFNAAMSERTAAFAPSVAANCDFANAHTVVDVGGGQGILLVEILHRHPHLRGILFEHPAVAADAQAAGRAADVVSRCDVVAGDFFAGVPEGADRYLLANVLHDWDDARCVEILCNCRRAMGAGGSVLIVERLIPDRGGDPVPTLLSDINMLVLTGGQERTNAEYAELLASAGLTIGAVQPVAFPYGVLEAYPM